MTIPPVSYSVFYPGADYGQNKHQVVKTVAKHTHLHWDSDTSSLKSVWLNYRESISSAVFPNQAPWTDHPLITLRAVHKTSADSPTDKVGQITKREKNRLGNPFPLGHRVAGMEPKTTLWKWLLFVWGIMSEVLFVLVACWWLRFNDIKILSGVREVYRCFN